MLPTSRIKNAVTNAKQARIQKAKEKKAREEKLNALRRENASAANVAASDAGRKNYRVEGKKNPEYKDLDISSRSDEVKDIAFGDL